jgi:redox-sensitive bicupin YhaK (pirin superfamily)
VAAPNAILQKFDRGSAVLLMLETCGAHAGSRLKRDLLAPIAWSTVRYTRRVSTNRRDFLAQSGAAVASALLSCRTNNVSGSPAVAVVSPRSVQQVLRGMATQDGAGVKLARIIGQPALRHLDPFVLLDRIHSRDPDAYVRGFPDHPHRGFETVTVMLEGRMRHRDSRGNRGLIPGGGAQWMTAGRGIVHSEMPEQETGILHGFQLWINLPAREKLCPQAYQDLQPAELADASLSAAGSRVRVIAGSANGLSGPVHGPVRQRPTEPTLLTLALADDTPFELDVAAGHNVFAFVYGGSVVVGPEAAATRVDEGTIAVLGPGNRVRVRAPEQPSGVLLAAGRPLGEPIVQRGPFVMNTEEEIAQAFADYRAGVLDKT